MCRYLLLSGDFESFDKDVTSGTSQEKIVLLLLSVSLQFLQCACYFRLAKIGLCWSMEWNKIKGSKPHTFEGTTCFYVLIDDFCLNLLLTFSCCDHPFFSRLCVY